ncbi:MAG TPA: hypothetical protein VMI53_01565 [Opitutaceae bacterium]|nr:hypothetical protein [Opitutaceae bacterium]
MKIKLRLAPRAFTPSKISALSALSPRLLLAGAALCAATATPVLAQAFDAGDLLVSRSVYTGNASTVTIGQALPGGGTAVANGSYPNVWQNETPDPSFGVTSPIYLDQLTTGGTLVSSTNVTSALAGEGISLSTSFSSKSELALNLSTDGSAVTFMGYVSAPNTLDVSNSNTPGHVDPTNPVASTFQRAVAQVNANGSIEVTPVNTYSGNNGRAAILANGNYYMVGNAGNGSGTEPTNIVNNTGVQMTTPGGSANTTVVGQQQGTPGSKNGFQYGFSVTQVGDAADKSGKDNNFRGVTVFNNTLYVTKGSGGNGINTVYQVGTSGTLPTAGTAASTAFSILPGFSTTLASASSGVSHPFGLWFANANTLYVADEGDGTLTDLTNGKDPNSGLQKWSLVGGTWHLDYTLQTGLNLGQQYGVANGPDGEVYPTSLDPATDGLRNITGKVNADGTVTIFGVTSTVSSATDQGADPNKLVAITDDLAFTTLAQANGESFSTLETAGYGNVLRGVVFAPIPELETNAMLLGALAGALVLARRFRQRKTA